MYTTKYYLYSNLVNIEMKSSKNIVMLLKPIKNFHILYTYCASKIFPFFGKILENLRA